MLLITFVIPLILQVLVQGTVQAKNFIYVNEDYPQEIFNGPAINGDENLQLNDEIFYNMYPPLIMRSSYNKKQNNIIYKANQQRNGKNKNNRMTENQKLRIFKAIWRIFGLVRDAYDSIVNK